MTLHTAQPASFASPLANIIFGSAPDPTREEMEFSAVERFRSVLGKATSTEIFRLAPYIDAVFVPMLSGRNLLAVMKLIELRAPAAIENMPTVRKHREHLRRSVEMAQMLSPAALERMIAAIRAEAGDARDGAQP
jgi:hypothetical protein